MTWVDGFPMRAAASDPSGRFVAAAFLAALALGCAKSGAPPTVQVLGESVRLRREDPLPSSSPWFDGARVTLVAARGETLGLQVRHRGRSPVRLAVAGARVEGFHVESRVVARPSTGMYGGSRGPGSYSDVLVTTAAPQTDPAYFEVTAQGTPGSYQGELVVDGRRFPVEMAIARAEIPPLRPRVWAYYDPRELVWAGLGQGTVDAPSAQERACIAMFGARGVLLSPDLPPSAWPARRPLVTTPFVPAALPQDPASAAADAAAWMALTRGSGQVPFAIPVDEPRTPSQRERVREVAAAVRAAGGGAGRFLYAVTSDPHPEDAGLVDLYITLRAKLGDTFTRWTYNGAPPRAGSMVLDAESPGTRTWGWIGWRWNVPVWYVWDALYWHDRHNRRRTAADASDGVVGGPRPVGRALAPGDSVSFDDGEDRGNLDGVLALPGDERAPCRPTLRLAALWRGLQDRALLELAARCAPDATAALAARMVPRALGDAREAGAPAWPNDEGAWEAARRRLIDLAVACGS